MINLSILLSAIALVESGNDDNAIGRHGERSRYQITATVWRQHEKRWPFGAATNPIVAKRVASRHLRWFVRNGIPETPWEMAYAWNCGRTATLRRILGVRQSAAGSRYAWRVERTYNDLLAKRKAKR